MSKKPLISDDEWMKFNVRANSRAPRSALPFCYAQFVSSLPECNPQIRPVGFKHACPLSKYCLMAYAERLGLDAEQVREKEDQFGALVQIVDAEEDRIGYVPELGCSAIKANLVRAAPPVAPPPAVAALSAADDSVQDEAGMDDVVGELGDPVAARPRGGSSPLPGGVRCAVLNFLKQQPGPVSKQVIIDMVVEHLGHAASTAMLHKVSVVLMPKSQQKYGYVVERAEQIVDGKKSSLYRLVHA